MSKPGHYSRERDARKAARDKGLKDEAFELLKTPKGWTWREKKQYKKVEGAKLHIQEKPTTPVSVNEPTDVLNVIKESSTGRFRYVDAGEVSIESFETLAEASHALTFAHPLPVPVPKDPDPTGTLKIEFNAPLEAIQEFKDLLTEAGVGFTPVGSIKTPEELKLEKRFCPNCEESVDTFISGETLRYVEHSFGDKGDSICNNSEEEVVNVPATGAPQSDFKPHELAQIQNGDPIPPGTFSPDSLPRREVIPRVHRSTVERPSKLVWEIAEAMHKVNPKIARKEVLAECVRQGIAYFTARTQYQVWLTIQKESAASQKEVNKE